MDTLTLRIFKLFKKILKKEKKCQSENEKNIKIFFENLKNNEFLGFISQNTKTTSFIFDKQIFSAGKLNKQITISVKNLH